MERHRLLIVVLVVLASNAISSITTGIFCYNAGWKEALDFSTANHVQAIKDMKKS